jgi:hypothetical protein
MDRYAAAGLEGLAERSHRPRSCPHQIWVEVEARICELRRRHPGWGPRRLHHELGRDGLGPVPSRSAIYRALVRHRLIEPVTRRRLGDPARFGSLAGVREFSGLVPSLTASGVSGKHGGPTKAGDAALREALFAAADHARRLDPTLAARYHRLMVQAGKHHNSALCHIATTLLTRIVACWRRGERYVVRDVDGRQVTLEQARHIIAERYTIPPELRRQARTVNRPLAHRTSRRSKESPCAPSTGPSTAHGTTSTRA